MPYVLEKVSKNDVNIILKTGNEEQKTRFLVQVGRFMDIDFTKAFNAINNNFLIKTRSKEDKTGSLYYFFYFNNNLYDISIPSLISPIKIFNPPKNDMFDFKKEITDAFYVYGMYGSEDKQIDPPFFPKFII